MLFALFVHDIEDQLGEKVGVEIGEDCEMLLIKMLKFADDMVVVSKTREGLQDGIDKMKDCDRWGLRMNISKSKVVVFRKSGRKNKLDTFKYGDEELEVLQHFKYLGFLFSASGSVLHGISDLRDRGRAAVFSVKRMIHNHKEMKMSSILQVFDAIVMPILLYGCQVWGHGNISSIKKLQIKFLKELLGVRDSTQPVLY